MYHGRNGYFVGWVIKKSTASKNQKIIYKGRSYSTMVDLGFLLITFFVFTTTMSKPTVMKMNEPKDEKVEDQMKVKESAVMTILLGKGDQIYYYFGTLAARRSFTTI